MSRGSRAGRVIPRSLIRAAGEAQSSVPGQRAKGIRRLGSTPTALFLLALLALLPARAGSAAQKPPEFAARAEIVTVDVVVLDRDGKPVPGLTRADFVVEEDGRPQTVTAFEAVEAVLPAVVAPATTTSATSVSRIATNVAGPPTRRTFAVVFDDMHMGDINIEQAKRAVETFVARDAAPGDRIVLVTVSDGRYWATNRGADDAAWREALKGVRSHRPLQGRAECRVTYYEAMQADLMGNRQVADLVDRRRQAICSIEPASPEELARSAIRSELARGGVSGSSGGPPSAAPQGVSQLMPSMPEEYARQRGQLAGSLRVVREIVSRLGATPGRKALVLVTEGFPVDPSLDVFREVREQAARANVAVHFLDPRGLATGQPDFLSAAGSRGTIPGPDLGPTLAMWRLEDGGAKALAEETGGRVLQTNDLVAGLAQVADESRVTYLLGYEPANSKRDGRYRKLSVEVLRPGLEVRARAGYFAEKGKKKPAPEPSVVDRVLGNPFDADGIPLRLAAYVMGPAPLRSPVPKTGVEVLVAGEVRLDAFATRVKDGRTVAEPKLKLFASSRTRETHESEWTLEVALTPLAGKAAPGQTWHPFLTRIAMEPGDHRARLVVESGGRVGSVTTDFIVPDFTEERLSTPILSDQLVVPGEPGAGGAGARRVMPVVRRDFPASGTLHAWFELHGAAVDSETGQPRTTAGFVVRSADGREWASGAPTAMNLEAGRPTRMVSLPLDDAPEGENELVLTVRDEISGRTFDVREPFRVEPAGPPGPGPPEPTELPLP